MTLKPCPFCGNKDINPSDITYDKLMGEQNGFKQDRFHFVSCSKCGPDKRSDAFNYMPVYLRSELIGYETPEEAAAHWNTRAGDGTSADLTAYIPAGVLVVVVGIAVYFESRSMVMAAVSIGILVYLAKKLKLRV